MTAAATPGPARAIAWRPPGPAVPPPVPQRPFVDAVGFASGFAPDAATRLGFRIALRPVPAEPRARLVRLAACDLGGATAVLAADPPLVEALVARLFGAPGSSRPLPPAAPAGLPAASSGWQCLGRLLGQAFAAGLAAADCPAGPARAAARVELLDPVPADACWFAADPGTGPGWLVLARIAPRAGEAAAGTDRAEEPGRRAPSPWQERAAALIRCIDLPVGVRIAELRMPLAEVAMLGVGALIPIERPAQLLLSVDGTAWQALPADGEGTQA